MVDGVLLILMLMLQFLLGYVKLHTSLWIYDIRLTMIWDLFTSIVVCIRTLYMYYRIYFWRQIWLVTKFKMTVNSYKNRFRCALTCHAEHC